MPKQGRISKLINKFTRVNEDASPEKLQEGELAKLEDMVLDNPYFVPTIRGGFQEWNAIPTASNIGRMIDVLSPSTSLLSSKNYLLAGYSGVIQRGQGGAWTTVISGMAYDSAEYGYFRHTAFADDIIITNGTGTPRRLTGNDLDVTTTVEIIKPDIDSTFVQIVDTDVGDLRQASAYLWALVYVTAVGERSNPSVPFTLSYQQSPLQTTSGGTSYEQVLFTDLPVPTDDRVVSKWLFRTEGWDGSDDSIGKIWYLRAKIDVDETTFVDGLSDDELDFSETLIYSRVPNSAYYTINSANRLWFGNLNITEKSYIVPYRIATPKGEDTAYKGLNYKDTGGFTAGHLEIYSNAVYVKTAHLDNNSFASDTFWNKETGNWTISGGQADCDGLQTDTTDLWQEIDPTYGTITARLIPNRIYETEFQVTGRSTGSVTMILGGVEGTPRSTNAIFQEDITPVKGDSSIRFRADAGFDGSITYCEIGAGGLEPDSYYQYMVTYVHVNGFESDPCNGAIIYSGGSEPNHRQIEIVPVDLGRIGSNNLVSDINIKYIRVYRTEGQATTFVPNSNDFYFVADVEVEHNTAPVASDYRFYDDLEDANLGAIYAPVTKDAKSAIAYSQVDRPAYFLTENIKAIFRDDQDSVTGILDDGNGILIFKENSIIKLYHTGASENWYIRKVWTAHGCDEPKSLIKAGAIIYFRYRNRMYSYVSGQAPQEIGYGKQAFLDTVDILNADATSDWIIWMTELKDASFPEWMLVWDRKLQTWYQFNLDNNFIFTVMVKRYNTTSGWTGTWLKDEIFIIDLETYKYDKTSTIDDLTGSPVDVEPAIKFPRITLDDVTLSKLRDIVMNFQRVGTGDINLTLTTNQGAEAPVAVAGTTEGLQRISGFSTGRSEWYEIELSGYIQSIEALRLDIRPIRRGIGSL